MTTTPLRSMTGYGEAEGPCEAGLLRVEIRTVNHRYLNLQLRTPSGFDRHQALIEDHLRRWFSRGHISVNVSLERAAEEPHAVVEVDLERARGYHEGLRTIAEELGVKGEVDLRTMAGFRDLFRLTEVERERPEVKVEELERVLEQAAAAVQATREAEGARMGRDLASRLDLMEEIVARIEERAPRRLIEERERLREAIVELLEGRAEVDDDRIAREIAHLAERWDIHEEVVRFRSHVEHFRETLEAGSEDGVGKRFGFISQEILREANTIGSKANDAEIARHVVALKAEIERLREQLENIE